MAAVDTTGTTQGTLAVKEKAKLRKVLGRLDLVLFTACAIVGLDSIAAAAEGGAQAITWLGISLVIFLVPYGMLVAELGAAFPVEGGPYEWARMSFGRAVGAVTAILYWLSNPLWVGGTLTAATIATLNSFVLTKPLSTTWEIVIGLVFIWVTTGIAIIAFRIGKWGPNIGTFVKIAVVGLFTALFIAFIVQHGRPHGTSVAGNFKPTLTGFLTSIGILIFIWVGFELSTGAAEEMRNPRRDVPAMIVRSGIIAAVLYALVIAGIVLVIPSSQLSSVGGFADAFSGVSATFHSHPLDYAFAALVIITLISSGAVWLEGADRTQAIAALDGAAPAWLGPVYQLRHPDRGQPQLRRGRLRDVRDRVRRDQRQPGQLLLHHAGADDLVHGGRLHLHLPRPARPAPQVPERPAPVPCPRRDRGRLGGRDHHRAVRRGHRHHAAMAGRDQ